MAGRRNARRRKKKAAAPAAGNDRFEDLPDHVLELVLSFLPSQEAVQTSVLARRWHHIWKTVPSLRIDSSKFQTTEDFNSFVDTLIELRDQVVPLHVCEIVSYMEGSDEAGFGDVESWLQYAVACQVQVLQVEMPSYHDWCYLSDNSVICEHLTRLVLYNVEFESEHPLDLSRCHALEVVDLEDCIINLGDIVFAKSLRHLRLHYIEFYTRDIRNRISAPGLVTCELSECHGLTPSFGSLPSVITAFIKIVSKAERPTWNGYFKEFCCKDGRSVLLEGLSGATNLELISRSYVEFFSRDLKWCPTFGNLKTVLLNDWCVTEDFTGLIYFLRHSPILERLTLQLSQLAKSSIKTIASYTTKEHFLVSKHLKVVEIKCYKVKAIQIQIRQIVKLLGTLGVTQERINIEDDFDDFNKFSFEQRK